MRAGTEPFRLHCEELTGQTENGADRQRKFRGILFPEVRPARDASGNPIFDNDGLEVLVEDLLKTDRRGTGVSYVVKRRAKGLKRRLVVAIRRPLLPKRHPGKNNVEP